MKVNLVGPASTPLLVHITSIQNTVLRSRYLIYYQIPIFEGQYKPIQQLQQLLLHEKTQRLKILDLQMPNNAPIFKQALFQPIDKKKGQNGQNWSIGTQIKLEFKFGQGELIGDLVIKGIVINKSSQSDVVFSMTVKEISGYINFLKFREKYRLLQNITRKRQFKLDHRLSVYDGPDNKVFQFPLTQQDRSHYFFTNRKLTLKLQQVYSVEDWQTVQVLLEQTMDLNNDEGTVTAILNILQKIKIILNVEMIKNQNVSMCEVACIRVLQFQKSNTNYKTMKTMMNKNVGDQIIIGTDRVSELAKVKPVMNGNFYDYQFGYLCENIKEDKQDSVYKHIDRLTKSFPVYPHLKNSKLLDIYGSKFLNFTCIISQQTRIKASVPLVYILAGLNVIETEKCSIKFYIQFSHQHTARIQPQLADKRRVCELKLKDIWNLGEVAKSCKQLKIKIISPDTSYTIPFTSSQVDIAAFRKQSKSLQLSTQYSQLSDNKYFMLTPISISASDKPNKLQLTKTQSISPFYIVDLFCSSSLVFQIISQDSIIMQGFIDREVLVNAMKQKQLRVILSSVDSMSKVIIIFNCEQICQKNDSLRTYYRFLYKLEFTDSIPSNNVFYNLQIKRLIDNKKLKQKISPQIADDGISTLHYFEDGFYESTLDDMELNLSLRKMNYNQQTEAFDNSEVINKKIIVNPKPGQALVEGCLGMIIKEEGYNAMQFDFYDENIKKRLKLHFEVFMRKLPLLDIDSGQYIVKIPQFLWKLNSMSLDGPLTLQLHRSTRRQQTLKIALFPDSPQQYQLKLHNYKDGLSVKLGPSESYIEIGYDRIINLCKLKCQIDNKSVVWMDQGQWNFGILNIGEAIFYFIIKWEYRQQALPRGDGNQSDRSNKTAQKKRSQRSYSDKIDKFAKTVRNMPLIKLKQQRNNLVLEQRQLTTKYIKREQTIIQLNKKIADLEQKITKRSQINDGVSQATTTATKAKSKAGLAEYQKMKQLYRGICQCGEKNPKYNGYCDKCLKQLRARYELSLKEYKDLSYEYQRIQFNKFNTKQKYYRVKNKLINYKERLKAGQSIEDDDINEIVQQLQGEDLKRKIEQINIDIFRMQDEKEKLEISSKVRLNALEGKIRKEDEYIFQMANQMQKLNQQLQALNNKINADKRKDQ